MKRRRKDGDKAEDADRGEANVRWDLGEGGIGVPACAWVHLYGGATRRAGGELAGAPIWRSRQVFFFFPSYSPLEQVHLTGEATLKLTQSPSRQLPTLNCIRLFALASCHCLKTSAGASSWSIHEGFSAR